MVEQTAQAATEVGDALPTIVKIVTQDAINRYAPVSGDNNPLHTDPIFAATTRFGGPIAHGMLILAYVSEALTAAFGDRWLRSGRLKARFRGPARPGDTVTVSGRVKSQEAGRTVCEVEARSQAGEVLVSADAEVAD
jgi:3-hydroxybutyryl-CoA dehydratase